MRLPAELACTASLVDDHPASVRQLRRLIVALAITGKLTEERIGSSASPELLRQLDARHHQLVADGKLTRAPALRPFDEADLPDVCPAGPLYLQLGDVAQIEKGRTGIASALPGPYPLVVTAKDRASCDHFDIDAKAAIVPLVSSAGHGKASLQRLHYQEGKFALGTILAAVIPRAPELLSARFIFEYLTSFKDELLVSQMIGTANVTLTIGKVASTPVPLVAPAVQRRVDELMALCDRLEAARAEREAARDRLTVASLARLNTPDPESFSDGARFALNTLPALAVRVTQIRQLRASILRLALRGSLVRQNPDDEPASRLLDLVQSRRRRLLESGYPNAEESRTQAKKQAEQRIPDELAVLPVGWAWATLMQCSLLVVDCKNKTAPYASIGIRLVRTTNVRDGRLNTIDQRFVTPETYADWSARCEPAPGDILITREAPMGEVCLIPAGEKICLGQRMMLVRLVDDTIDPAFMLYSLRDPDLLSRVQDKPIGATVQHLRVGGVETLMVPLPPLAEQRRIVAKLDELMAICHRLEGELDSAERHRERLLEALLHESLQPAELIQAAA